MKLHEVLDRSYGYWILDTGELVHINRAGGHMKYARDVLGPKATYDDAFDEGWLRIVYSTSTIMYIQGTESTTNYARKMAWRLLKHHKDELDMVIIGDDVRYEGNPPKPANQAAQYMKSFG